MRPTTIMKHLEDGKVVVYTILRYRGYTSGDASLMFRPQDKAIGVNNIEHRLKCFRFDEKPYGKPRWEVRDFNPVSDTMLPVSEFPRT